MAKAFQRAADRGPSVLGLCNLSHQLSLSILLGRAQVSGGMRLFTCMGLSLLPREVVRSGRKPTQVRHSPLGFPFLRVRVFQNQKFTGRALDLHKAAFSRSFSITTPWRGSARPLASMVLWAAPRAQLALEPGSVACAAAYLSYCGPHRPQLGLVWSAAGSRRCSCKPPIVRECDVLLRRHRVSLC